MKYWSACRETGNSSTLPSQAKISRDSPSHCGVEQCFLAKTGQLAHLRQPKIRDLARRCRDSMRHQGVAGSPPPAVLIPQDVRNVVREPASHALGQRGLSARSAAAAPRPSCLTVARLLAAPRSCMAGASILGAYWHEIEIFLFLFLPVSPSQLLLVRVQLYS